MRLALVGASGYAEYYFSQYEQFIDEKEHPLCAVIDPYVKNSPFYKWITNRKIPVYDTLDQFYRNDTADLVMLVCPIAFHRDYAITALRHGSAVLCEKPVTATVEDAMAIHAVWRETGLPLGVGFQWSFSNTMLELKRDILAGKYGKPLRLRTYTSWKRPDSYYDSSWKGRIKDSQGRWVLDSIAMNATAHFLHNLFFILGDEIGKAELPAWIEGSTYRGRDIESYDTIFLRGGFKNGCEFGFVASHVGERVQNPCFVYEFENGVVKFGGETRHEAVGFFANGESKVYGIPQSPHEDINKIRTMIGCAETGTQPPCTIDTVLPHLKVCAGVAGEMTTKTFPAGLTVREADPAGVQITGLCDVMERFYETLELPAEQGCEWAAKDVKITF